jgi:aminoglycoside phosphotransferase (APT) family kinase protein
VWGGNINYDSPFYDSLQTHTLPRCGTDSMTSSADTQPVRPSEQLDWTALENYARPRLSELLDRELDPSPMTVEQFPGGHSNLTYLLRFGADEFAFRRPPFGPVAPKAHDVARECRILQKLNPVFPLAPKPYLLSEDLSVIAAPFYIMERRQGLVVRYEEPPQISEQPGQRERISAAMVDVLADLHTIDVHRHGLVSLGKPEGFVERQVRGWIQRWHGSKTTEQGEMNQLSAWLLTRLPSEQNRPSLLHGDYKLDNVMLDASDPGRVLAVLDWEMSAVGDPLVDFGIFLAYWVHTGAAARPDSLNSVTTRPGWFTRDQIIERYALRTGIDVSNIKFYEVFAVFKLAVVLQQIFFRYHRGQTDDARFASLDKGVESLAHIGARLAE